MIHCEPKRGNLKLKGPLVLSRMPTDLIDFPQPLFGSYEVFNLDDVSLPHPPAAIFIFSTDT